MRLTGFLLLESYVRFPIPHITAILLLAHIGLGCYWHHSHICTVPLCEAASSPTEVPCEHTHQNLDEAHGHHDHSQPAPHQHQCDIEQCTFLPAEPSPVKKHETGIAPCFRDMAFSLIEPHLVHSHFTQGQHSSLHLDGLPLRTHLLHGVLLI